MRRQVAKIIHNGEYVIIYDKTQKHNKYCVYHNWYVPGEYGLRKRTHLEERYGNFSSAMYHIFNIVKHDDRDEED